MPSALMTCVARTPVDPSSRATSRVASRNLRSPPSAPCVCMWAAQMLYCLEDTSTKSGLEKSQCCRDLSQNDFHLASCKILCSGAPSPFCGKIPRDTRPFEGIPCGCNGGFGGPLIEFCRFLKHCGKNASSPKEYCGEEATRSATDHDNAW